ncbi:MAG: HAD-IIIC family phosphatase [Candidatus Yanofskybacteria bacterium]|nr:HAD-IIIC family phosphatase [Candidatus Yanofskybacteria bacterium]
MIIQDKIIVIDLDGTLCEKKAEHEEYTDVRPRKEIVQKLQEYREQGFSVIVTTARGMRTFEGNVGKINAVMLKTILEWLNKHHVPYDEVHVGKPWCGMDGFYVDDRTIRPDEFMRLSPEQIRKLIE